MATEPTPLTPSEDLAIEALIARFRLGETLWTFEARHMRALGGLADKGLVTLMHGVSQTESGRSTFRASLTEVALAEFMPHYGTAGDYVSPIWSPECGIWFVGPESGWHRVDCNKARTRFGLHRVNGTDDESGTGNLVRGIWHKSPHRHANSARNLKWTTVQGLEGQERLFAAMQTGRLADLY